MVATSTGSRNPRYAGIFPGQSLNFRARCEYNF